MRTLELNRGMLPTRTRDSRSVRRPTARSRLSGVTLVEVLVTVVVLSIGLLGLAALQANATRFNHGSHLLSQANALALDMTERMRANTGATFASGLADVFDATDPGCGQAIGNATPAREMNQWKSCIENSLPNGRGAITRVPDGDEYVDSCGRTHSEATRPLFVIEITWDNARFGFLNEGADACVVLRTETEV